MQWNVFAGTALAVLVLMLLVWAYSVKIKDASIVDIIWGLGSFHCLSQQEPLV